MAWLANRFISNRKFLVVLVLLALLASLPAGAQESSSADDSPATSEVNQQTGPPVGGSLQQRAVPVKPARSIVPPGYSETRLHLKLREGSQARLRDGLLVSGADELGGLSAVLARYPGISVERVFSRPEAELSQEKLRIEANSGREQADKNLYYAVVLPAGTSTVAVLDDLNSLDIVEIALPEPLPQPLPVTPNLEPQQIYLDPAPTGFDANVAKIVPGGRGENVKIIDIEYDWNQSHEDLAKSVGTRIPNGVSCDPFPGISTNHGTAVLGEIIASENGFGVTGAIPVAGLGLVNAASGSFPCANTLGNAIDIAHANLSAGDVILIEQQTPGPDSTCTGAGGSQGGLVAVEWFITFYDAIVSATSDGIIVVEAAGNGSCNYDSGAYGSTFPADRPDSGAIIVGAGNSPDAGLARSRLGFSGHGTRVDVQGYGNLVVTSGYGDLQGGAVNQWYTNSFSGTSSASPHAAAGAAILSSVAQQNGSLLTPREVRTILKTTGTPQNLSPGTLSGNIGPLPNLNAALGKVNDAFSNASVLPGSAGSLTAANVGATGEASEPVGNCGADSRVNSVWWSWTPSTSGAATISTIGSGFDTTLAIFTGGSLPSLVEVGCNDNIDGVPNSASSVTFNITAGTTYRIKVDGSNANVGSITLNYSSAATSFTLTVSRAGSGSGSVRSTPAGINCGSYCSEAYATGTSVALSPRPAAGSTFTGWSGACSGSGSCVVSMTQARTVTATFTTAGGSSFTLTVSRAGSGSGSVRSTPAGINCGSDCTQAYASGTSVALSPRPAAGSTFAGWSGACSGTGSCVVSMTQARSVTATFTSGT